jgi:hypothetical protein
MKSGYKARVFIFLFSIAIFLFAGVFGVYRSKKNIEDKLAETMVSSRLRAMAFEGIAVLSEGNLKGDGHAIDEEEKKKVQLIFGKLEEMQKALVNGNEVYKIPDAKSPRLTKEILKTSPLILSAYELVSQMIHNDKTWHISVADQSINQLRSYADEMSSVTALVLSEGDEVRSWSNLSFLILIFGSVILILGAYFISLKPMLKRVQLSDKLIAETRKEIELMRQRWSQNLLGLYQQFRLPGLGFQNVQEKLEGQRGAKIDAALIKQFESTVEFIDELVDEVRLLAEMETQSFQSRRTIIDLQNFLETTTNDVNNVVGADNCRIHVEISRGIPSGLVQDQQLLHHCIIQVLANHLITTTGNEITIRVSLLNQDSGLVQIKFSFISKEFSSNKANGNGVFMEDPLRMDITQKFVEKLGGKLSSEMGQPYFTVVFETADSVELSDVSKLIGLKAALFLSDIENQVLLKKQLSSWGVYAVPFSKFGTVEEMESVLGKFHFCITDAHYLNNRVDELVNALNRNMENQSILFFVVCKDHERPALTHSFIRGFLSDPVSIDELMKLLLNFSTGLFKQNVRPLDVELKNKGKLNFLVAHSDDLMRIAAQRNILVMGYNCDIASDPFDTVSSLAQKEYHVLLAESSFFTTNNAVFSQHLKMLNNQGSDMVVIEIKSGETIEEKLESSDLIDQSISERVGVKEVQSVVNEWFEV